MKIKQFLKENIILVIMMLLLFLPFTNILQATTFFQDTSVQVKTGLESLERGEILNTEIFSWHENLTWVPHGAGWYIILGVIFKYGGLIGLIIFATILNLIQASIIFEHINKNNQIITSIALIMANSFQLVTYNVRPWLISNIAITLILSMIIKNKYSIKKQCSIFIILVFIIGWIHGGIIPFLFIIWIISIAFDTIFKNYNHTKAKAISTPMAIVASVLNPAGVDVWTYGFIQKTETEAWEKISEWQPINMEILNIICLLIWIVSIAVDERYKKFDKTAWMKVVFTGMFFAAALIHARFSMQFAICLALFMPEHLSILIKWINENLLHLPAEKFEIKTIEKTIIISSMCLAMAMATLTTPIKLTLNSIEKYSNLDHGVIDAIKQNDYKKVLHEFDYGTWLLFYDIKVAIDNRCDPYMSAFNEDTNLIKYMVFTDIKMIDEYCEKYKPDSLLLSTSSINGESIIYAIDNYCTEKYKKVYENTLTNEVENKTTTWVIYEPTYK